jgi:DNA-binding NarL/FixJ family response regulator
MLARTASAAVLIGSTARAANTLGPAPSRSGGSSHRVGGVAFGMALQGVDQDTALQQIRGLDSLASLPVAILTGTQDPGDEAELRALGADAFLCKPMDGPPRLDQLLGLLGPAGSDG